MNAISKARKDKQIILLVTALLLAAILFSSVGVSKIVSAGGRDQGKTNLLAIASPTPSPHLLWQYNVVVALNPEGCIYQQYWHKLFLGMPMFILVEVEYSHMAACEAKGDRM